MQQANAWKSAMLFILTSPNMELSKQNKSKNNQNLKTTKF